MASITNSLSSAYEPYSNSATSQTTNPNGDLSDKESFLKLLVSQLQYQDPLNPADPAEFTAQLTQFSELEQLIAIQEDVAKIAAQSKASAGEQTPAAGSTEPVSAQA